jgi:hypothetical protein
VLRANCAVRVYPARFGHAVAPSLPHASCERGASCAPRGASSGHEPWRELSLWPSPSFAGRPPPTWCRRRSTLPVRPRRQTIPIAPPSPASSRVCVTWPPPCCHSSEPDRPTPSNRRKGWSSALNLSCSCRHRVIAHSTFRSAPRGTEDSRREASNAGASAAVAPGPPEPPPEAPGDGARLAKRFL